MNDLSKNIDGKKTTDMAVLDFSKAFDVIPHSKLLMKLDYYGIRANTRTGLQVSSQKDINESV